MVKIDIHQWEFGYILNRLFGNLPHLIGGSNKAVNLSFLTYLIFLIICAILALVILVIRLYFRLKKLLKETSIFLELTPPAYSEKSGLATQQLFSTIYSLGKHRTTLDKILGKKPRFSLEIVSTRHQGIRYLIRCTPNQVENIRKNLLSFLPQASINIVDDYLPKYFDKLSGFHSCIVEYKLTRSFGYPLQRQSVLKEHDPVAYITGMMTKLLPSELVSFQIILASTLTKQTKIIADKIKNNDDPLGYLNAPEYPFIFTFIGRLLFLMMQIIAWAGNGVTAIIREIRWGSGDVRSVSNYQYFEIQHQQRLNASKPVYIPTPYEQEIINSVQGKIGQPLFDVAIRLLVIAKDPQELQQRVSGFTSSLEPFFVPEYQSLKVKRSIFNLL